MTVGPFYNPEDTRQGMLDMEEMLRKIYWELSC
jgi:hypothetical protein